MSSSYEEWIRSLGIQHEFMYFNSPVKTAEQAKRLSGEDNIIKSIVVVLPDRPVLCILPGEKRIDFSRLPEGARMATPSEVREITGFPPGGVPPIVNGMETWVDPEVAEMEWIVGGGGKENMLLKIRTKDLLEHSRTRIVELS